MRWEGRGLWLSLHALRYSHAVKIANHIIARYNIMINARIMIIWFAYGSLGVAIRQ